MVNLNLEDEILKWVKDTNEGDMKNYINKIIETALKQDNIDDVKITLLHEVVHAVTVIIEAHDFVCDEYRAYTTCSLYK